MHSLTYLVPVLLVVIVVLLKLVVGREVSVADTALWALEIPVDVTLLALSFAAADTVAKAGIVGRDDEVTFAFVTFLVEVVLGILVVFIWRCASRRFYENRTRLTLALGTLNFLIVIPAALWSLLLISGVFNNG